MTTASGEINVGCWNLQGLIGPVFGNKLRDNHVENMLNRFNVIGFCETHCSKKAEFVLDGFVLHSLSNRVIRSNKPSGGLAVMARPHLIGGMKIQHSPSKSSDIIWIKFDKKFFNWEKDLFMGFAYITPHDGIDRLDIPNLGSFDKINLDCNHFLQEYSTSQSRLGNYEQRIEINL